MPKPSPDRFPLKEVVEDMIATYDDELQDLSCNADSLSDMARVEWLRGAKHASEYLLDKIENKRLIYPEKIRL